MNNKWIPVSERRPEPDQLVWLYREGRIWPGAITHFYNTLDLKWAHVYGNFWLEDETWGGEYRFYETWEPSHWMPLPKPPFVKHGEIEWLQKVCPWTYYWHTPEEKLQSLKADLSELVDHWRVQAQGLERALGENNSTINVLRGCIGDLNAVLEGTSDY